MYRASERKPEAIFKVQFGPNHLMSFIQYFSMSVHKQHAPLVMWQRHEIKKAIIGQTFA